VVADLARKIRRFIAEVSHKEQPVRKLHDATVKAMRAAQIESQMGDLSIKNHVPNSSPDQRIVTGGNVKLLKLHYTFINYLLQLAKSHRHVAATEAVDDARKLLSSIESFIVNPLSKGFPAMIVEVKLYYAEIAVLLRTHRGVPGMETETTAYGVKAKEYLQEAERLCGKGFRNADELLKTVKKLLKLLDEKWYEEVTSKELEAIKLAMVSGHGGISTHSGHWYNCENGHPVSLIYPRIHRIRHD
jgi:hypothetical protein